MFCTNEMAQAGIPCRSDAGTAVPEAFVCLCVITRRFFCHLR